jgi:hypothetical protein
MGPHDYDRKQHGLPASRGSLRLLMSSCLVKTQVTRGVHPYLSLVDVVLKPCLPTSLCSPSTSIIPSDSHTITADGKAVASWQSAECDHSLHGHVQPLPAVSVGFIWYPNACHRLMFQVVPFLRSAAAKRVCWPFLVWKSDPEIYHQSRRYQCGTVNSPSAAKSLSSFLSIGFLFHTVPRLQLF